MSLLLDTNVCVDIFRGRAEVSARMGQVSPDDCAVSEVTAHELRTGVYRCSLPDREMKKLGRLFSAVRVLAFDRVAGEESARIRHDLEKSGLTVGPYDVLIAGHARAAGLTLVTSNTKEFGRVAGLKMTDWRD